MFFINLIVVINGCILHCIMDHAADDRPILNRIMYYAACNDCVLLFILLDSHLNGRVLLFIMDHAADDRSILNRIMYYAACNGCILLAIFLHAAFCFFLKVFDRIALCFINLIVVVNGCILYYVMNHAADDRTTLHSIQPVIGCHVLFQPGNVFILFPVILLQIANGTLLTVNLSLQIADVAL